MAFLKEFDNRIIKFYKSLFYRREKSISGVSYEVSSLRKYDGVWKILWSWWEFFRMEMHPMWRNLGWGDIRKSSGGDGQTEMGKEWRVRNKGSIENWKEYRGQTVTVKVRFTDFKTYTRAKTLDEFTNSGPQIRRAAFDCLGRFELKKKVRLIGVRISNSEKVGNKDRDCDSF